MESIDRRIRNCIIVSKLLNSLEKFSRTPSELRGIYPWTNQLPDMVNELRKSGFDDAGNAAHILENTVNDLLQHSYNSKSVVAALDKLRFSLNPYDMTDSVYEFLVKFEPLVTASC